MQCAAGKLVFLRTLFLLQPCFGCLLLLPLMSMQGASCPVRQAAPRAHQFSLAQDLPRLRKTVLLPPRCQLKSEEVEGGRQAPESTEPSLVEKSTLQFTLQKYRQDAGC